MRNQGAGSREEIIAAAQRVFARHGIEKTTITDIVREARVGRATFYKMFHGRDAIFRAVLEREIGNILSEVRAAVDGAQDTRGRLKVALLTHMSLIRENVNVYRVTAGVLAEIMPPALWRGEFKHMVDGFVDLYRDILDRGAREGEIVVGDPTRTAWVLVLLLKGLFLGSATGDIGGDRESVVEDVITILMDGMRPRGAGA